MAGGAMKRQRRVWSEEGSVRLLEWSLTFGAFQKAARSLGALLFHTLKWWLRTLERRPFTGILALGVLVVAVGVALRVAAPEDALVISPFEVPDPARTPL